MSKPIKKIKTNKKYKFNIFMNIIYIFKNIFKKKKLHTTPYTIICRGKRACVWEVVTSEGIFLKQMKAYIILLRVYLKV
jgi:hypothetical protein